MNTKTLFSRFLCHFQWWSVFDVNCYSLVYHIIFLFSLLIRRVCLGFVMDTLIWLKDNVYVFFWRLNAKFREALLCIWNDPWSFPLSISQIIRIHWCDYLAWLHMSLLFIHLIIFYLCLPFAQWSFFMSQPKQFKIHKQTHALHN